MTGEIDALRDRAARHGVAAVRVNPAWVHRPGSSVVIAAGVGFPLGASETAIKAGTLVKMIIESAVLTPEEIIRAGEIAHAAGER